MKAAEVNYRKRGTNNNNTLVYSYVSVKINPLVHPLSTTLVFNFLG